jgi:hypothetical protein
MLTATRRLLATGSHNLDEEALESIRKVMGEVEARLETRDVKALKALYDRFVEVTVPLAGEVMSEVAREALHGKTIAQVLEGDVAPARKAVPAARGSGGEQEKDCGDLGEGFRSARDPDAPPPEEEEEDDEP